MPAPSPLLVRLRAARQRTDALFEWLRPHALLERPIAERHRLIFYVGHLDAFDWNLVSRGCAGRPSRHEAFERLFAFGIDPVDGELPTDGPEAWPALDEVRAFVTACRRDVDEDLARTTTGWLEDGWAAHLAIEHRLMHAETLAYLFRRLPPASLHAQPAGHVGRGDASPANEVVHVPRGVARPGLHRATHPRLGWDNEYEAHDVEVGAFDVDRFPVTNQDFLRFVEAGGYAQASWWSASAWAWRSAQQLQHPATWRRDGSGWRERAFFSERPLDLRVPVQVSHAEASAYAAWRGARLMTELEWHRAALGAPDGSVRDFPWGAATPQPGVHGTFGFSSFDALPVGATPAGRSAFGVDELVGNGWEWTSTVFAPFAGFEALPFYRGYSANFFDGKHFVLKGASAFTDVTFLRASFRNWFQPHYPHVFAKFRCVHEGGAA